MVDLTSLSFDWILEENDQLKSQIDYLENSLHCKSREIDTLNEQLRELLDSEQFVRPQKCLPAIVESPIRSKKIKKKKRCSIFDKRRPILPRKCRYTGLYN